jgi:hypothetical protein
MANRVKQIELVEASASIFAEADRRRKIEEPPAVRLIAIDDCLIWAPAGLERQLDEFYQDLLGFERVESDADEGSQEVVYRAENFRLRIEVVERPGEREDFRTVMVAVPSINEVSRRLIESEIEYVREKGLTPGADLLLLSDPAGNPVSVGEVRVAI